MPYDHTGVLITPVVEKEHVLSNEKYIKILSESELNACIYFEKTYYCESNAYLTLKNSAKSCEWQLIQNHTATECEHRETKENEKYIKLQNNQWLYSTRDELSAKIKCEDSEDETRIQGNGIIILNNNCEIQTPRHILRADREINTKIKSTDLHIQLHKVAWPAKTLNYIKFKVKLQDTINKLEINNTKLFWHQLHHYSAIYAIIITLIFVISYFYTKLELAPEP